MASRIAAFVLVAAGLLAACEDGTPERDVAKVKIVVPASDALKAMKSDLYRNLGLRRSIVDSGQRCKKVVSGAYQQDWNNLAMWTAHCTDTGDWAIFIAPNDDVQVRRCADEAQLKLPACKPLPPAVAEEDGTSGPLSPRKSR
jgi:hypothetical protein